MMLPRVAVIVVILAFSAKRKIEEVGTSKKMDGMPSTEVFRTKCPVLRGLVDDVGTKINGLGLTPALDKHL